MLSAIRPHPARTALTALTALTLAAAGCAGARTAPSTVIVEARADTPEEERWSDSEEASEEGDLTTTEDPALAAALRLYQQGDHLHATLALHGVTESAKTPGRAVEMAWFFLGKSLTRQGYALAALAVFDRISLAPEGAFFGRVLPWVAQLSFALPDEGWAAEIVGRYGWGQIRELSASRSGAIAAQIVYLSGKGSYAREAFADASERLGHVSPRSRSYLKARFLEGVSDTRQQKSGAAARAFEAILEATPHGEFPRVPTMEVQRVRDVAWMALGRLEYAGAKGGAEASLRRAIEAYSHVSPYGEQKDEARMELAWTRLRLGDDRGALSEIEALPAEFREERAEVYEVKGAAHLYRCEVDLVENSLTAARAIIKRQTEELTALTEGASEEALYMLAQGAMEGKVGTAAAGGEMIVRMVKGRELGRLFAELGEVAEEEARAGREGLGGSGVLEDLRAVRGKVRARIGAVVRAQAGREVAGAREAEGRIEAMGREVEAIKSGGMVCVPRRRRR